MKRSRDNNQLKKTLLPVNTNLHSSPTERCSLRPSCYVSYTSCELSFVLGRSSRDLGNLRFPRALSCKILIPILLVTMKKL